MPGLLAVRAVSPCDGDLSSDSFTSDLTFFLFFHIFFPQLLTCSFSLFILNLFFPVDLPGETQDSSDEEQQRRREGSEARHPGECAGGQGF